MQEILNVEFCDDHSDPQQIKVKKKDSKLSGPKETYIHYTPPKSKGSMRKRTQRKHKSPKQ